VCPEHNIGKVHIYPINKDIKMSAITKYRKNVTPKNLIGSGNNGSVFSLGMDLVIKKSKKNALVNKSLMNEAKKLDMLYTLEQERGIKLKNVQSGITGFEFPNGDSYLVSTLVKGERANYYKNPLNTKNLNSLMDVITELDKGSTKDGRLMVYDLNLDNINFTKSKAGIFDFEYMRGTKLDDAIRNRIIGQKDRLSTHISDTSNLESNVRSFESAGLWSYLQEVPQAEAKKIFGKYLEIKSKYHKNMSEYYFNEAKKSIYSDEISQIAKSEASHAKLLAKPTPDIIKAEATKIQMANFLFVSSSWCQTSWLKFNPRQVVEYYQNGNKFFNEELKKATLTNNKDKITYYQNCINLFNGWKNVLDLNKNIREGEKSRIVTNKCKTLDKMCL
jgi:hypothetical protein